MLFFLSFLFKYLTDVGHDLHLLSTHTNLACYCAMCYVMPPLITLTPFDAHFTEVGPEAEGNKHIVQGNCDKLVEWTSCILNLALPDSSAQARGRQWTENSAQDHWTWSQDIVLTAFLRCNSHAMQFTQRVQSLTLSMFTELCNHRHNQFYNIFITPEKKPCTP